MTISNKWNKNDSKGVCRIVKDMQINPKTASTFGLL